MRLIFSDPEGVRQSSADPGVTLGFLELPQRCLTSAATGEREKGGGGDAVGIFTCSTNGDSETDGLRVGFNRPQ